MHPSRFFASSTFRLALLYLILFSVSVGVLFGFFYWSTAGYMEDQMEATIDAEITGLAEHYQSNGLDGLHQVLGERIARQQPTGSSIYLLADFRYRPLIGNINRWPQDVEIENGWITFELEDYGDDGGAIHLARARTFRLEGGFRLLVGRDFYELARTRSLIIRTLAWGLAITLALGLLGGIFISRRMLRRIEAINTTSREIMSGELGRRIDNRGTGDELDDLAGNLNQMLDQIEYLMEGVRRVSDNIAHDLKTPLARLRNRLERVHAELDDDPERKLSLEQAISEADRLLSTFSALLRIARIETRPTTKSHEVMNLSAVLADVVELYEPLAEEKQQTLRATLGDEALIVGDRDLVFQAIANLLDNAVKYAPGGGVVGVESGVSEGDAFVAVTDDGPGIPEQSREKVFDRFFRLDSSRTGTGNGLGLSLVRAVVQQHNGRTTLEDNKPGLRITIRFPVFSPLTRVPQQLETRRAQTADAS